MQDIASRRKLKQSQAEGGGLAFVAEDGRYAQIYRQQRVTDALRHTDEPGRPTP